MKRAIVWVREHAAEHGADPAFLVVTGRLRRRTPRVAGGADPERPALPARLRGRRHDGRRPRAPYYGVYDFAGATGTRAAVALRDRFLAPKVMFKDPTSDLTEFETASPLLRANADAPPFFVVHGRSDSLVDVDQARQFVAALRAVSAQPVAYAELPGTQHAFDVFPSIRSAHVVRGVDRFLRCSYDAWMHGRTQP